VAMIPEPTTVATMVAVPRYSANKRFRNISNLKS